MGDAPRPDKGIGPDGINDYTGQFSEKTLGGLLYGHHSDTHLLFIIPEAVGSINSHNTAIQTELKKYGHVDTITQADALNYPDFAQYNIIVCGTDNGTAWTTSNLDHVKEFEGTVICVDATVAAHFLIGTDGGDAASKTVMTAITQIEGNDLGIGIENITGLAAGSNTVASSTTFNTIDMSDADITETFYGTEAVADNTDVLLAAIYKRQPDGTRGILSDASQAIGTRWFYGCAYSANDLNTLGKAVLGLMVHMALQASTATSIEISGDVGDIEKKLFGNQASSFNNGNPLVEYMAGRNSVGTKNPVGKSLYDLLGVAYVDGGGAFNLVSIADDLKRLGQFLIDGTSGGEAGNVLPTGKSLFDVVRDKLGAKVTRSAADIIDGTTTSVFTVAGGRVLLTHLEGEITGAAVDNETTNIRFTLNPTVGTTGNLCADLDVDLDEVGAIYTISGVVAAALQGGSGAGAPGMSVHGVVLPEGVIEFVSSNDGGGGGAQVKLEAWYIPLDAGATIASA